MPEIALFVRWETVTRAMQPARPSKRFSMPVGGPGHGTRRNTVFGNIFALGRSSRSKLPGPAIPAEIVYKIAWFIKAGHSCRTCYVRDLNSFCLCTRTFHYYATSLLYDTIVVSPPENINDERQLRHVTRQLVLLHRTLSSVPGLAFLVRDLTLPDLVRGRRSVRNDQSEQYAQHIANVISCCPNLERVRGLTSYFPQPMGLYPALPIAQALYKRPMLKEHIWWTSEESTHYIRFGFQIQDFPSFHTSWARLETLVLRGWVAHGSTINGGLSHAIFCNVFRALPSLANLYLSAFTSDEFRGDTLVALCSMPKLEALRLESLLGISTRDILRWLDNIPAQAKPRLRCLSLVDLEYVALTVEDMGELFSRTPGLKRFTLRQSRPLLLDSELKPMGSLGYLEEGIMDDQPSCWCPSLVYLHWEVSPFQPSNAWIRHCIIQGGFPGLKIIRAPLDEDCMLQDLCRPCTTHEIREFMDLNQRPLKIGPAIEHAVMRVHERVLYEMHMAANNYYGQWQVPLRLNHLTFDFRPSHPYAQSFLMEESDLGWIKQALSPEAPSEEDMTDAELKHAVDSGWWCDGQERDTEEYVEDYGEPSRKVVLRRATTGGTTSKRSSIMGPGAFPSLNILGKKAQLSKHIPRRRSLWDPEAALADFFL